MDFDRFMSRINPLIVWLLSSPMHGLLSKGLLVLHIQGRRTGKCYSIPVGYQRAGDQLQVLISNAPRKQWWRNFSNETDLQITLQRERYEAQGRLMTKDSPAFESLVLGTLKRIPALVKQFDLEPRTESELEKGLSEEDWRQIRKSVKAVAFKI